jgi:CFEM domain
MQDCIDQSQDDNCSVTDVTCLCQASASNFLPNLLICMNGNCDENLDNDLLLTPLQIVCRIAGAPIPESAIQNAENQASSVDAQKTTTVTVGERKQLEERKQHPRCR